MAAADPTYPLLAVAHCSAAVMMVLVLLTSFVRHNWNLGLTFLCFWLFIESIADGVGCILWPDNADIKHYVYCDIGTHRSLCLTKGLWLIT